MITISRWTRGRFLIVWISCLYVIRGTLRAFTTTGGDAPSVIPRPPPSRLPRTIPQAALPVPLPVPLPVSVPAYLPVSLPVSLAVSKQASARAPPLAARRPASRRERARPVLGPRGPRRVALGPAGSGASWRRPAHPGPMTRTL